MIRGFSAFGDVPPENTAHGAISSWYPVGPFVQSSRGGAGKVFIMGLTGAPRRFGRVNIFCKHRTSHAWKTYPQKFDQFTDPFLDRIAVQKDFVTHHRLAHLAHVQDWRLGDRLLCASIGSGDVSVMELW